ncbi:MAG: hypothetical protein AABY46_00370, partial [Nitrospirota bacterium]
MKKGIVHYHLSSIILSLLLAGCGAAGPGNRMDPLSPLVPKPEGRWGLFWTSVEEARSHRLTAPSIDGRSLAWSPDGTRLAFISNRDGNDEV